MYGRLAAVESGYVQQQQDAHRHAIVIEHVAETGIALGNLASGLTAYLLRGTFGVSGTFSDPGVVGLGRIAIPPLIGVPVLGWAFGRQSALSRVAHLFCELYLRLAVVGLAKEQSYSLPLTQSDLSDAMGLSLVHTNRTCAALRQRGLATFAQRTVTIHSWERLQETAEFEPEYLHLGNHKRK